MRYRIGLLALALLAGFVIPVAYGINLSFESNGVSESLGDIGNTNGVQQEIVMQSGTLSDSLVLYGPGSQSINMVGPNGGYAETGFTVLGSKAVTYYSFEKPGSPYAYVIENLDSSHANDAKAYALGVDSAGGWAYALTEVVSPYSDANLVGYKAEAIASSNFAYAGDNEILRKGAAYTSSGYVQSLTATFAGNDLSYTNQFLLNGGTIENAWAYTGINDQGATDLAIQDSSNTGYPSSFISYAGGKTVSDINVRNGQTGLTQIAGKTINGGYFEGNLYYY
jgi:hypothetical protein